MSELQQVMERVISINETLSLLSEQANPDDAAACRAMLDLLTQSESLLLRADLLVSGGPDRGFFEPMLRKTFAATSVVQKRLAKIQAAALIEEKASATIH
jgi:hypothetical protein